MISMLKRIFDTSNRNRLKINAIYMLLAISNIALFAGLITYYANIVFGIDFKPLEDVSAVIASIIILGFISYRLPKIQHLGESPIYGMSALILVCSIGFVSSHFSHKLNMPTLLDPYLDMFKYLSAVLVFILLAAYIKPFKEILRGKYTRKNQLICLIIFTAIGLFSSYVHMNVNNAPANIRCLVVMISGLFGGPVVGVPVGIISGAYRYALGGVTALPCSISTVISGIIGSLIYVWNDRKFPGFGEATLLMALFTGFEMLMIVVLTPPDISFPFVKDIYPVMLFASVVGMIVFSIVVREERQKGNPEPSDEELKIREIESEIESLRQEMNEFKKERADE
ncbi:LytS/YhcK type 5TM receptor domain-containing protein [uncultured Methanobrevibacter sp.]|uniref:LytS/YhcK type 5TM receptor domain-containing protein n=2 Tax=Methanobrevibacter TaxID=2172 RepID=UPI0025F8EB3F|nr:LytS/YhcK type 5TM receptor domain-containing protein [uncultured Methanobrevibacter sp.]